MPRPAQPLLSHPTVVTAALKIIDSEGLDAFSLPRLARELNVRAPSLYHHFQDKADILETVARAIVLETRIPRRRSVENWIEWFVELSLAFRRSILRHSNAAPVLLRFMPRDVLTKMYERSAAFLVEVGIPEDLHVLILDGMDKLTLGAALTEAMKSPVARSRIFANVTPDEEPLLARALTVNGRSAEELFAESVRAFLRGVVAGQDLSAPCGIGR